MEKGERKKGLRGLGYSGELSPKSTIGIEFNQFSGEQWRLAAFFGGSAGGFACPFDRFLAMVRRKWDGRRLDLIFLYVFSGGGLIWLLI